MPASARLEAAWLTLYQWLRGTFPKSFHEARRNPMSYTVGMAARATGLSKSTVYRAIEVGRISATRTDIGEWAIDPAELHGVFPPIETDDNASDNGCVRREATAPAAPDIALRNARLEAEL